MSPMRKFRMAPVTAVRLSFETIPQIRKTTVMAAAGAKTPRSILERRLPLDSSWAMGAGSEATTLLMMTPP